MIDAKESAKIIKGRKICDLCLEENCIKDCEHSLAYSFTKTKAAYDYAIETLEKQIPKRPEYYDEDFAKCPNCDNDDFEYDINNWGCNFCPECGQALDWSDTDD